MNPNKVDMEHEEGQAGHPKKGIDDMRLEAVKKAMKKAGRPAREPKAPAPEEPDAEEPSDDFTGPKMPPDMAAEETQKEVLSAAEELANLIRSGGLDASGDEFQRLSSRLTRLLTGLNTMYDGQADMTFPSDDVTNMVEQ